MSDPLGLLDNPVTVDPLGLLAKPRPIPELRSEAPEKQSVVGDLWDRFMTDVPAERAKAANAVALSDSLNLPASVAYEHMDEITKEIGLRDQPTLRDMIERPVMGGVVYGLLSHPLATAVGVTAFGVLSEAENYLSSKAIGRPYQFGAGKGLADMLPEDTAQGFKDLVWTADMAWKAVAAGGAIKVSKPGAERFAMKYMRDVTEKYNLPRNVYISPEKIREFHGLGREDVITPEEAGMLKDMGLTRQQYVDGLKYGLDLEIPGEKLVTIVDKPWWATMKRFFRASPYEETVVTSGKGAADKHVSGLIEGPAEGAKAGGAPADALKPAVPAAGEAAGKTSPLETKASSGGGEIGGAPGGAGEAKPQVFYHGTTSKTPGVFDEGLTFLAPAREEALPFAENPILSMNRGGEPAVLEVEAKPGKTKDIADAVDAAFLEPPDDFAAGSADPDPEAIIAREAEIAKEEGYRYVSFRHPSVEGGEDFVATVSLYPKEDLAVRKPGRQTPDAGEWSDPEGILQGAQGSADGVPGGGGPGGVASGAGGSKELSGQDLSLNELLGMAARSDEAVFPLPTSEYDKIRAEASRIAYEKLSPKFDLKKRRETRAMERQFINDARQDPVFGAMQEAIKSGGLKREWLRNRYDNDTVNELAGKRIGLVTKDGWMGLDQLADMHGFQYEDDLMNAMLDWKGLGETGKKYAKQFEEQYSELVSEAEMEEFHLALLDEEAKILRGMIKQTKKPSSPGIKKAIREQTGQVRVDELMVSEYEALKAGMQKAEEISRRAFRAGNIEGSLAEKERQIEMAETRREKLKAKEEANDIRSGIVKLTKDTSIPEDYQARISDLLEDFDLLPRSTRMAARVESAREFLERQKQAGEDVTIPESMLSRIERYGRTHWRELTLDQLREIYDQAQMYAHLGKLKNKLIAAKKGREFEDVVETIVSEIGKNWGVRRVTQEETEGMFLEPTMLEKLAGAKESYLGSLTKVETYLRRLDGFKDLGPIWETVYLPIKQASDVEYRRLAEITKELQDLFGPMRKTLTKGKFRVEGIEQFLTRETMIMAAMNSGNEGNLAALRENKTYNWDDAKIQKILSGVTKDEWALVRGVWDLFEKQYPDLAAVYKNLSGTTLKKVEGDYFPLVFDRRLSWIADRNATEKELRDFFQSIYSLPSVRSGSTIERVGGKLPPKLKFSVIFEKLAETNHYITHAEAVRDAQKILGDSRVRAAIEGAPAGIGGPEAYREMMSWLQDVARQQSDPLSVVESAIKTARINTSAVAMAWKFSTAAVQFLGGTNVIYKVGAGEFAKALAEFYTNREATVEKIKGMSSEISGRAKSFDRELRDAYVRIGLEHFYGSQAFKDSYFSLISMMDMAVAYPTWLSAYNKGMKDFGNESTKAIEYADMTVRMTQGTALVKDLAGIQRGSELKKIISMFYTFFSSYHQMMSDAWLKFKFDKTGQNFGDLMKAWWWLTILPATIDYMMKERDVPSPGHFIKNVLQFRLTAYPVIRDITGAVLTDYDYQMSPVARAGEVVARAAKEAVKVFTPGEEVEFDTLLRYSVEASGYAFGLPTGQAVVTMQGLMDLWNGETSDVTRLLFRAPREESE